ncbi:MAG TPA: ATP-binding protein, partial [Kofleriaceae bacterium]
MKARGADRPLAILPFSAAWFVIVLTTQLVQVPHVATVLAPFDVVGVSLCMFAWARLRAGRLSVERAWQANSLASGIQAVTYVVAFFLTHSSIYQAALSIHILAVCILDVRGRAIQSTILVATVSWAVGSVFSPIDEQSLGNILVVLAACSVSLIGHIVTMRTLYTAEWLRLVDEQRTSELESAHSQLLQAHKLEAIGQLAAGVAHEINTPTQYVTDNITFLQSAFEKLLGAIDACRTALHPMVSIEADLAREVLAKTRIDYKMKQVPRAIEQSLDGLRKIASLVAALREFSHPSGGIKDMVDLNAAIATTIEVTRNEWKYAAAMVAELDPDLPAVWCLRDEISQVILNLIVNAAHAIGERTTLGKITVRTRISGADAVIEVLDDGAGIPDAIRRRVFEPFFTTK